MNRIKNAFLEGWRRFGRYLLFSILLQVAGVPAFLAILTLFNLKGYSTEKIITYSNDPAVFLVLVLITVFYVPFAFYWVTQVTDQFTTPLRKTKS